MNYEDTILQNKINKGIKLIEIEKYIDAVKIFEELKKNKKTKLTGLMFLGIIHIKKNEPSKAKNNFYKIIEIDKKHWDANLNLGLIFFKEKNYERSEFYLDIVISLSKNNLTAIYHKGLINFYNKKFDEARELFNLCLEIDKNFVYAYLNLAHIYLKTKKFKLALEFYEKVLVLKKDYKWSKFNMSWCYFALNQLDNAFKFYEFRKEKIEQREKLTKVKSKFNTKEWVGENLNKKNILIISEQGIGDTIQFFRYLYLIKDNYDAKIIFYTDMNIRHLFKDTPFQIVSDINKIENIDYYQHLLSLPGIFYRKFQKFQNCIPYIRNNENINIKWKNKLSEFKKPIIALNWQGDKNFLFDDIRSIKLSYFKDILSIDKYTFISVQKNFGTEQIKQNNFEDKLIDLSNKIDLGENSFEDTISILKNIDLLITSDTAIAHLAGTLQINTYLLLSYNPEWRWYVELKNRCFYPNLKIIQQEDAYSWKSAFDRLKEEII